jgi:hypothetical protein
MCFREALSSFLRAACLGPGPPFFPAGCSISGHGVRLKLSEVTDVLLRTDKLIGLNAVPDQ